MTQHPNAEILRAIADGKAVQWRFKHAIEAAKIWRDYADEPSLNPSSDPLIEWRVKPGFEPLKERWYFVQKFPSGVQLNTAVMRSSLNEAARFFKGTALDSGLRRNFVGLMCMHTDETTVRKVEFFSKAELKAKGVL